MSELISGKDAKLAWANGEEVEFKPKPDVYSWGLICDKNTLGVFNDDELIFRLKPRTITLNGIEVPACGHDYQYGNAMYILNSLEPEEYSMIVLDQVDEVPAYWWRTEAEVKQVVAALRSIFR